jgi:hypothetical protein
MLRAFTGLAFAPGVYQNGRAGLGHALSVASKSKTRSWPSSSSTRAVGRRRMRRQ